MYMVLLTSNPPSTFDSASSSSSASATEIHPAAANLSFAASHDNACKYCSDNGSGECVIA